MAVRVTLATGLKCGTPSGAEIVCYERATHELKFTSERGHGGWYVCELCTLRVYMWLEDHLRMNIPEYMPGLVITMRELDP